MQYQVIFTKHTYMRLILFNINHCGCDGGRTTLLLELMNCETLFYRLWHDYSIIITAGLIIVPPSIQQHTTTAGSYII